MSVLHDESPRDTVTLKGMRFHALIGVLPHEEHVSQPLEVDVSAEVATRQPNHVVDYSKLYDVVDAVVSAGHTGYLEQLAEQIARGMLAVRGVEVARVTVRKPHVALRGPLAYAEVSITRARSVTSQPVNG